MKDAGHKWSKNYYYYTSIELLTNFFNVVLPMEDSQDIQTEQVNEFSAVTGKYILGILSKLKYEDDRLDAKRNDPLQQDAMMEQELREIEEKQIEMHNCKVMACLSSMMMVMM